MESKEEKKKRGDGETDEKDDGPVRPLYLTEFLKELCCSERYSDVKFIVGKGKTQKIFPAHKVVLAASSPLFEAMLYPVVFPDGKKQEIKEPCEIEIKDTSAEAFAGLLKCVYTDETEVDSSNIADLIKVGKKYQIEKLQVLCADFMQADVNINNALELYQIAPDLLGDEEFGLDFIRENTEEILETDSFLNLSRTRLLTLLKDDRLSVDELPLFHAVVRWAKNEAKKQERKDDSETLKSILADFVPLIRFPTMDVSEIAGHVATSGLLEQSQLLDLFKYVSITDAKEREKMEIGFNTNEREGGFMCKESKLLEKGYRKDVLKLFGPKCKKLRLDLLYRGSRDGFTASAFHQRSDNKGATFTVISSNTKNVFGGYMEASWAGSGNYSTATSWLFSLKNKTNSCIKMEPSSSSNNAYCHSSYGPTWGGGHDLHVNNSMKSNSNSCNPNTYTKFATGFPTVSYDNTLLAGAPNWTVDEIEVFKVSKK
jgi:hypothetical protein